MWTALHMGIEHNRPTKNISFFLIEFCPWKIYYSEVEVVSSKPVFEWCCLVPPVAPGSGMNTCHHLLCYSRISAAKYNQHLAMFRKCWDIQETLKKPLLLTKTLFLMSRVVGYVFKCPLPHTARRGSSFMKEDRLIRFI